MDGMTWSELTERLKVQLTPYPAVLSIGGLLLAAIVDHYAHGDIATELLYVPPLLVLAYWGGRRIGFWGAALAIILAFIADLTPNLHGPELRVFVQNTLIRLAIFPVIAWLASELKSRQDRLSQLAHEDSLTGLANRPAFFAALETELHRAERHGGATSVLYLDVDHFKSVNDHHGHERGDALLRSIAGELVARVRTTDLVARLGGDEFAILLILTDHDAAQSVAQKLATGMLQWAQAEDHEIGFSIGVATAPLGSKLSPDQLLARADAIMYEQKRRHHPPRPEATHTPAHHTG